MRTKKRIRVLSLLAALCMMPFAAQAEETAEAAEANPAETNPGEARIMTMVLPVPEGYREADRGTGETRDSQTDWIAWENEEGSAYYAEVISYKHLFSVKEEEVRALYEKWTEEGENILWKTELLLDGSRPACALAVKNEAPAEEGEAAEEQLSVHLLYFYGCNYLNLYFRPAGKDAEGADAAGLAAAWLPVLSEVSYSVPEGREGLPDWMVTPESFEFTIQEKNNSVAVAAGNSLAFTAAMEEEQRVRAMDSGMISYNWLLLDAMEYQKGNLVAVDAAKALITNRGVLTVYAVEEITPVMAVAVNPNNPDYIIYSTVLLVPKQTSLALDETQVYLFAGEEQTASLTVSAEPENTLLFSEVYTNIEWTVNNPNVVSLTDAGTGTVTLEPLAAGNAWVQARDSLSGRTARANVTVLIPVDGLEITGADTVSPGRQAGYKAVITPKNAGYQQVAWTLDVPEETATVSEYGVVTVMRDTAPGTVLTLTCQALGTSREILAVKEITVE